jgi:hypothetical protein
MPTLLLKGIHSNANLTLVLTGVSSAFLFCDDVSACVGLCWVVFQVLCGTVGCARAPRPMQGERPCVCDLQETRACEQRERIS